MRALLVEDDAAASRGISLLLEREGIAIDSVDTGGEALDLACRQDYDLILLDLMLPDVDGYEVIRRMRLAQAAVPLLVLSGLSRPNVRVRALGMGADDFMTKPFDKGELIARIRAIVRRSTAPRQATLQVGLVSLNLNSRGVTVAGTNVRLTGKEFAILELLVLRKGLTLSKEALLTQLYRGTDEPEMKIIDVFVCKLRKKLALAGAPDLVRTVWGLGYTIPDPEPAVTPDSIVAGLGRTLVYDA
jgi:two-component system, cell cycle response regulator CtrA